MSTDLFLALTLSELHHLIDSAQQLIQSRMPLCSHNTASVIIPQSLESNLTSTMLNDL